MMEFNVQTKVETPVTTVTRVTRTRVYVWLMNESVVENLVERHSRPYVEWRSHVAERLRDEYGYDGKLTWRQTAGCSCGCSPGFVLDELLVAQDDEYLEQVSYRI